MKKTLLFFSFLVFCITMMAQQPQRGKFKPDEFKAKLESYVTKEAGFTQAEAQAFYPIYFEMKGKQRGLQRKIFQIKQNAETVNTSENSYAATIQKIKDLNVEMAQLEVTYYKKLCQAISPQKVYKAMCAEDRFHRQMLENFDGGRNSGKGERPKRDNRL